MALTDKELQHFSETFNLGRVNSLHSSLKRFLGKHADRPATKHLNLYLMMFWWQEKQKEQSKNELPIDTKGFF